VNVKEITPDLPPDQPPNRVRECADPHDFLAILRVLRRVVMAWALISDRILLTFVAVGRRYGPARIIGVVVADRFLGVQQPVSAAEDDHGAPSDTTSRKPASAAV
jgi:hypothetical protein